ncbi:MAG: purine-nucleoside phosphorylase [Legionellaceae bacterium]|nr:purine-nucleoside phosphorylase [Legionellaceae bacterium]
MTINNTQAHQAAAQIKEKYPQLKPKIGIVLGSGLGSLAEQLDNTISIPYSELAGFPRGAVHGHAGKLVFGTLSGVEIVCLQGRAHAYEGNNHEVVKTYVRTLKLLGCEYFLATNAAGSLHEAMGPGELVVIKDHINLQPGNPLVGPNDDEFGSRFYPLDNAYDSDLRHKFLQLAETNDITLHQGVYMAVLGPNYETAAEIRAFRLLGADVVGMSTVPEVLVATHCGMKVAVISTVTNYATGLNTSGHSHDAVVEMASLAAEKLNRLIKQFIKQL